MSTEMVGRAAHEYKEVEISSLHGFLKEIGKIKEIERKNNIIKEDDDGEDLFPENRSHFFRGQVVDKTPTPSLFRNNGFIEDENKMFFDVINRKPEDFDNCKTTFEYLVKMQHYGLPTRLLDITSNPLVALYFACKETNVKKPKRTIFHISINDSSIKNYTSDSITILSSLAKVESDQKKYIKNDVIESNFYRTLFRRILIKCENSKQDMSGLFNYLESNDNEYKNAIKFILSFKDTINDIINDPIINVRSIEYFFNESRLKKALAKIQERYKTIKTERNIDYSKNLRLMILDVINSAFRQIQNGYLLHEIKQDKPYFKDEMKEFSFNTIFCVKPKLTNSRIISQSGSFLMFPFKMEEKDIKRRIRMNRIYIKKGKESKILKELELLNIKEDTLFNELDVVCKSIEKKYKKPDNTVDLGN